MCRRRAGPRTPEQCAAAFRSYDASTRTYRALSGATSPQAVIADARTNGYPPGGQRAFVVAKVLEHCAIIVVGAQDPDLVRGAHMTPVATMDEAELLRALG